MRETLMIGQKFSILGIGGGGGGSLKPKIINVPADYPTLIEAERDMGRHYYIGGDPSVTDNDPTKTNTGQTFLLGQDIMWDGVSAYFAVGDNAIWADDGIDVKTVAARNINLAGKGLKDVNVPTAIKLGTLDDNFFSTIKKTIVGAVNEVNAKTNIQYDATIGAAGSGADYDDINTATAAGKFNLLVIGDFAQPTNVTVVASQVVIHVAERLTMEDVDIDVGVAGIKVRGGILRYKFTTATNKIFKSSAAATLDIADIAFFVIGSTIIDTGIANMYSRSKHLIHNVKFVLSNTGECGFLNAGSGSSFTDLTVIGGGANCSNFLMNAADSIISNIHISGVVKNAGYFITTGGSGDIACVVNNISYKGANKFVLQTLSHDTILSNIKGDIQWEPGVANNHRVSNCEFDWIDGGNGSSNNEISNVKITGAYSTTFTGAQNQIVNFKLVDDLIINGNANKITNLSAVDVTVNGDNNQLLLTDSTTYTDNGSDNSNIEAISEDETLSADSDRLLSTQKAIKTYADNIAKGITVDYYFSDTPDGVIANYDLMYPSDTGEVESTAAASIVAADTLIQTFITQTTEPNFTTLLAGIYDIHIHAAKTAGTKDAFIYAEFYKRTHPAGVETLLATSDNSALLTGSNIGYTLHFSLIDDEIIDARDRLVVKFYGSPSGVGTDPTATLYLEGTNSSRIDIHTTTSSWMLNLENIIYVNGAGNDSNAGKNMGTPKLTIASALTAAAAQSPTSTNIVVVKVLGGLRYAEDVTVPSWVVLDMSDAISNGQVTVGVTMGTDSFYYFNEAIMPSGKEAIRCAGVGNRYIKGNFTTPETNSVFLNASAGATIYLDIVSADAVKTGATFYILATAATLYLKAQIFRETVASTSSGAKVFRNIADDGANANTTSINEIGNHIIKGKDSVILGSALTDILEVNGSYHKWLSTALVVAYNSAQLSNITGDGTTLTLIYDTETEDRNENYDTGTGIFTAPTTGFYLFVAETELGGLAAGHTSGLLRLETTGGNPVLNKGNFGAYRDGSNEWGEGASLLRKMTSGNTAKVTLQVSGGAKAVDLIINSSFSIFLLTR